MFDGAEDSGPDDVELRLGAVLTNLPVIRSLAANIAMRADFDLDAIADLKLAVDEACSTLITQSAPNAKLRCVFRVNEDEIRVVVTGTSANGAKPTTDSFGWRVLTTLTDHAATWVDAGNQVHIELTKRKVSA